VKDTYEKEIRSLLSGGKRAAAFGGKGNSVNVD